jgi:hypothetical protein
MLANPFLGKRKLNVFIEYAIWDCQKRKLSYEKSVIWFGQKRKLGQ